VHQVGFSLHTYIEMYRQQNIKKITFATLSSVLPTIEQSKDIDVLALVNQHAIFNF